MQFTENQKTAIFAMLQNIINECYENGVLAVCNDNNLDSTDYEFGICENGDLREYTDCIIARLQTIL